MLFFFLNLCPETWNFLYRCKLSFGQVLQWVIWDVTPSSISHVKRWVCHITEWNSKTEQITEKKMMNVDLPWKGTSGYNKNRLCCVPLAMNTAVFIVCGKDFADDKTKLNTEISLQSLEGTWGNFTGTGCSLKKEDKTYLWAISSKEAKSLNYYVFLTFAIILTLTNYSTDGNTREWSPYHYFYNNFYFSSEYICIT